MASDFGYTTVADVAARLDTTIDATTTPSTTDTENIISEAEAEINKVSGKQYTQQTVTNELHDYHGEGFIIVKESNLQSVTSVEYTTDDGDTWSTVDSDNYRVYEDYDQIKFKPSSTGGSVPALPFGDETIRVTYTAGPSSVPKYISKLTLHMAIREVVSVVINNSANQQGGDIKVGPIEISDPSMFSMNYLSQLDDSIDERLSKLSRARIRTTVGKSWQ